MKLAAILLAGVGGLLASAAVIGQHPGKADDGVIYRSAGQLGAGVKPTDPGVFVGPAAAGAGATVLMVRRTANGSVEMHERFNDIFVAERGRATLVVGGHAEGDRQVTPGEWRGGAITGGRRYQLRPGDMVWIPAKVPHRLVLAAGVPFEYLAFKFPAQS